MTNTNKTKCSKCGHTWKYNGCLVMATCPSCLKKIEVKKNAANNKSNKYMAEG